MEHQLKGLIRGLPLTVLVIISLRPVGLIYVSMKIIDELNKPKSIVLLLQDWRLEGLRLMKVVCVIECV